MSGQVDVSLAGYLLLLCQSAVKFFAALGSHFAKLKHIINFSWGMRIFPIDLDKTKKQVKNGRVW